VFGTSRGEAPGFDGVNMVVVDADDESVARVTLPIMREQIRLTARALSRKSSTAFKPSKRGTSPKRCRRIPLRPWT
jgi:hypothetical protein